MNPILKRIKRCVIEGRVRFTYKADLESESDNLEHHEIFESILNAADFYKVIRSRAPTKGTKREYLYIIKSFTYDMTLIYTKGKLMEEEEEGDVFYILISAKLALEG